MNQAQLPYWSWRWAILKIFESAH